MAFFEQAITVLQTLVIALGAGLGIQHFSTYTFVPPKRMALQAELRTQFVTKTFVFANPAKQSSPV